MISERAGVTAENLITTSVCNPWLVPPSCGRPTYNSFIANLAGRAISEANLGEAVLNLS